MRDILITAIICGMLPIAIKRPWIGALMFVSVSLMTPAALRLRLFLRPP